MPPTFKIHPVRRNSAIYSKRITRASLLIFVNLMIAFTCLAQVDQKPFKTGKFKEGLQPAIHLAKGYQGQLDTLLHFPQPVFTSAPEGTVFISQKATPSGSKWHSQELTESNTYHSGTPFYIHTDYVTNAEYRALGDFVLDSIQRRILLEEIDFEKFVKPGTEDYDGPYPLNYEPRIDTRDSAMHEAICVTYYPKEESVYPLQNRVDFRKLKFENIALALPTKDKPAWPARWETEVASDSLIWMRGQQKGKSNILYHKALPNTPGSYIPEARKHSRIKWWNETSPGEYMHDHILAGLAEFYSYHPYFQKFDAVGVDYQKAFSFVAWMTHFHQKYLDEKGIPLWVYYALPTQEELNLTEPFLEEPDSLLRLPKRDLEFIRISNGEYQEFMHWVRDSIAHEALAKAGFSKYASLRPPRNDTLKYEMYWEGTDLSRRQKYRRVRVHYPPSYKVNWNKKINWKKLKGVEEKVLKPLLATPDSLYQFEWRDFDFRMAVENPHKMLVDRRPAILDHQQNLIPDTAQWQASYPLAKEMFEPKLREQSMIGISYAQARAYYIWKKEHQPGRIKKGMIPEHWIIPTKEEWQAAQTGKLSLDPFAIPYPQTRFRYTIRFFPK